MPATTEPQTNPPRPPRWKLDESKFTAALQALRNWSGLTLVALENKHPQLKRATISDYLRGKGWPDWEWVEVFVRTCLAQAELSPAHMDAELQRWTAAWATVAGQRQEQSRQADAEQHKQAGSGDDAKPRTPWALLGGAAAVAAGLAVVLSRRNPPPTPAPRPVNLPRPWMTWPPPR